MRHAYQKYFEIKLNSKKHRIDIKWLKMTEEMEIEEYKSIFEFLTEVVKKNQIRYWLGDTRLFSFNIIPSLQEWTDTEVYPRLAAAGLKKMALIYPEEFITKLFMQNAIDAIEEYHYSVGYEIMFFRNKEDADKWLVN